MRAVPYPRACAPRVKKHVLKQPVPYVMLCSLINPRRACAARVALCVCLSVCYRSSSYSVRFSLQPTASTAFLGFQLVDFRKSLPFKSYGEKKPICKLVSSREPFSRTFWTNETQELLEAQPVSRILLQTLASSAASVK